MRERNAENYRSGYITSLALGACEAVRAHTAVRSHTPSSVKTAIFTNSWEEKEILNYTCEGTVGKCPILFCFEINDW